MTLFYEQLIPSLLMLVLDIKRTKEDFLKKKGKSSEYTKDGYSFIFKGLER